jgi:hypothetical protein
MQTKNFYAGMRESFKNSASKVEMKNDPLKLLIPAFSSLSLKQISKP